MDFHYLKSPGYREGRLQHLVKVVRSPFKTFHRFESLEFFHGCHRLFHLTNAPVQDGAHSLKDLTVEILKQYGIAPAVDQTGHPVLR